MGLVRTQSTQKTMKNCGITVDYEWAYKRLAHSHDLTGKSPAWVDSAINFWREGYLEGFLNGWTEGTLRVLCKMKQAGMPSDMIAAYTDVSLDVVEMITVEK